METALRGFQQTLDNSCVPACMVLIRQARDVTLSAVDAAALEIQYHQGATPQGHPLSHSLSLGNTKILRDTAGAILDEVTSGHLVVATVNGPRWVRDIVGASTARKRMCDPGDFGVPFHCVLCVGTDDGELVILDPWYPAASQRFLVDPAAFAETYLSQDPIAFTR